MSSFIRFFECVFPRITTLLLLVFLPTCVYAQNKSQLNKLIFDAVLLDPVSGEERINDKAHQNNVMVMFKTSEKAEEAPTNFTLQALSSNIQQYNEQLTNIEIAGGPFATDLYETLLDLARQYQQMGDHEKAIETYDRAEYVSRINHGLFHPEQFASIEGRIESHLALEDISAANEKQRYLLYLSKQFFGNSSMDSLPALTKLADQNMDSFNTVMSMPKAPTISITSGTDSGFGSAHQPSPRQLAFGSLYQARQNYSSAIALLIENQQYFSPELPQLEYKFIETLLLQTYRSSMVDDPDYYLSTKSYRTGSRLKNNFNNRYSPGYFDGRDSFERMLVYVRNNPQASYEQLLTVLLEYGDWHLLFGRSKNAFLKYQEANDLLARISTEENTDENLIRPAIPVHLPLITAKPNSREKFGIGIEEDLEYEGYIDVAFTISRYGRAKNLDIISTSGKVSKRIERRLIKYLRNSPFRPKIQNDGSITSEQITLRYYFTFADQTS